MPVNCPKRGVLLYGRRCIGCTCERADVPIADIRPAPWNVPPIGRQFVVVPRDPKDRPDVPLRVPSHYCMDCGQRRVPCFECEPIATWPMTGTQDAFHVGQCDQHGRVMVVCPRRGLANVPAASVTWIPTNDPALIEARERFMDKDAPADVPGITPLPDPFQNAPGRAKTGQDGDGPLDPLHHERMRERVAASVGLAVGFILGVLLTLATIAWLNYAHQAQGSSVPVQVE